ncbi:MAG TPA: hypothetical protein VF006_01070 [Longimicrobium sp.]
MSTPTLTGTGPKPAGAQPAPAAVAAAGEKFPRRAADPQDDWPEDVHLPDEKEDDEC